MTARPTTANAASLEPSCPDCHVGIGQAHLEGCDVARCLATGLQRLGHLRSCRCPRDVWTGRWPGEVECEEFGWMRGPGMPDLNRLLTTATWDPATCRWTRPDTPRPDC
jgi:hypothetical protein